MEETLKVVWYLDDTYEVLDITDDNEYISLFKGSLSDCNAWIQLHKQGLI